MELYKVYIQASMELYKVYIQAFLSNVFVSLFGSNINKGFIHELES